MTEEVATSRTIVVGVDASPAAGAALRWAIEYAGALDAEVIVVHAFEAPVVLAHPYGTQCRTR
jgi:nucleotide-binding universal stress UspA family protein